MVDHEARLRAMLEFYEATGGITTVPSTTGAAALRWALEEIERLRSEVGQLRDAIRGAGFGVMETSGSWSIHDVSERGKKDAARELQTVIRNVDLEVENKRLLVEMDRLKADIAAFDKGYAKLWELINNKATAYASKQAEVDQLRAENHRLQVEEGNFAVQERNAVHQELSAAWAQEVKELEKVIDGQKEEIGRLKEDITEQERHYKGCLRTLQMGLKGMESAMDAERQRVAAIHQQDRED